MLPLKETRENLSNQQTSLTYVDFLKFFLMIFCLLIIYVALKELQFFNNVFLH